MTQKPKQKPGRQASSDSQFWFDKLSVMKKDVLCICVLYGIILILFGKIVFNNMIFADSGDTVVHMSWVKAIDHIRQTEANEPLWIPNIFSGMPVFAGLLFPRSVNFLETLIQIPGKLLFLNGDNSWFVLHYFLMGLFMYLLARRLQFSHLPSLLAAVTLMLNPYAIGLAQGGHGSKLITLSYLPLLFLFTYDLFQKRNLLSFGLLGVTIGTMFLSRHPQIAFYGMLTIGCYAAYEILSGIKRQPVIEAKKLILFALAVGIGIAIYSYELLPTQEYAKYSIRGGSETGESKGLDYDYATSWSFHPLEAFTYIVPSVFGFSSAYEMEIQGQQQQLPLYWGWMPFTDGPVYIGLIPLMLGFMAFTYKRDRLAWFLMAFSILILFLSFGKYFGVVYNLFFYYVPYFNKFRVPVLILYLIPFTFGLLAAQGAEFLVRIHDGTTTLDLAKMRKRMMMIGGAFAVIVLLGFIGKSGMQSFLSDTMFHSSADRQLVQQYGLQQYETQVISLWREKRFEVFWNYFMWSAVMGAGFFGLIYAYLNNKLSKSFMVIGMIAIIIIDLSLIDGKFINPKPNNAIEEQLQPDPAVQQLKAESEHELFRVLPVSGYDGSNLLMYHLLQSVEGYSPAKLKIYQDLRDSCFNRGNQNVFNMLNVKYLIGQQRGQDGAAHTVTQINTGYLPRAWFVDSTVISKSSAQTFSMMNTPNWNPRHTAILEKGLPANVSSAESANVTVSKYESREITLQATTPASALLVLSEIYYPAGWKATIDGKETEIFKTNYVLRSVVVPAGSHTVVFTFNPESYNLGYTLSQGAWGVAGLIVLLGCFQHPWVKEKFKKKNTGAVAASGNS